MSTNEANYFGAHPTLGDSFPDVVLKKNGEDDSHLNPDNVKLHDSYTRETVPRGAWIEVDLDAIAHNIRIARKHVGVDRQLMAVVKADGYGHGSVRVAQAALGAGVDQLAVSSVEEGVELREAGITAPILILSQPPMRAIPYVLAYDLMPTVISQEFALALGEEADLNGMVAKYHLAIDTGMNRIGTFYLDVVDFMQEIGFHRGLQCAGVFTHFATADDVSDWDFRMQMSRFNEALQLLRNARIDYGLVHAANSAATVRYPESYFDMVRVGITMYGLAPGPVLRGRDELKPAMSVKAQIIQVKEPQMGEGVSYGFNYRVAKPVQIATVPIGYADGIRRNLSGRMRVLYKGRPVRQVGNICMDQMMIEIPLDYSAEGVGSPAEIGEEIVILGSQGDYEITADMMADELDTISYELICMFGLRLPRIYV